MRFPFFRKTEFFSTEEKKKIVEAIGFAEKETSGEMRVFVESKNSYVDPMDRAKEVFYHLKMQETEHRNAVLLYIAIKDKQLALYGDKGIHEKVGDEFWNQAVKKMLAKFSSESVVSGIVDCLHQIGETLREKFPYDPSTNKNELPDEIVFGK